MAAEAAKASSPRLLKTTQSWKRMGCTFGLMTAQQRCSAKKTGRAASPKKRKGNTNMTYTKINLYLDNGIPEALSNLWYGTDSSVVEIRDAVEDAKNGKDLLNRIQKMKLLRRFTLDRENEKRIRFKGTDCWGNISYLEIIR